MFANIRSHALVLSVAAAALTVGLVAPAAGHGVSHALFAHNADKLDGLNSTAFARASVVQTTQGGVGWVPYGSTSPAGLDRVVSGVSFTSPGSMVMPLAGPGYQNRKALGLAKIELCYYTTSTAFITSMAIYASEVGSAPFLYGDDVDRSSTTGFKCDTVTVNARAHKGIGVLVQTAGAGSVRLEGIRATWSAAAATGALPRQAGRVAND
jgi:hypothetical protein